MMHSFRHTALFALATGFMAFALSACRTDLEEAALPGLGKDEPSSAFSKLKASDTTAPVARSDVANPSDRGVGVNPAIRRSIARMRPGHSAAAVDAQTVTTADVSIDSAQRDNPPTGSMGATTARATEAIGSTTINLFLPGTTSENDNADDSMDDDSDESGDGNGNDNSADDSDDSEDDSANDNGNDISDDSGDDNSGEDNSGEDSADDSEDDSANDNGNDNSDDSGNNSSDDDSDDSSDDSSDD